MTQMFNDGWMNKENLVYLYTIEFCLTLIRHENQTIYNVDQSWRYYAKWNEMLRATEINGGGGCT